MRLPVELRIRVVSVEADGVVMIPQYWWENQLLRELPPRKVKQGEEILTGTFEMDVNFQLPIVR